MIIVLRFLMNILYLFLLRLRLGQITSITILWSTLWELLLKVWLFYIPRMGRKNLWFALDWELSKLPPGDIILADFGSTIQETIGCWGEAAPFTKGKKWLSKLEVDTAYRLSKVCIHAERVIGVMRLILKSTLPIRTGFHKTRLPNTQNQTHNYIWNELLVQYPFIIHCTLPSGMEVFQPCNSHEWAIGTILWPGPCRNVF